VTQGLFYLRYSSNYFVVDFLDMLLTSFSFDGLSKEYIKSLSLN